MPLVPFHGGFSVQLRQSLPKNRYDRQDLPLGWRHRRNGAGGRMAVVWSQFGGAVRNDSHRALSRRSLLAGGCGTVAALLAPAYTRASPNTEPDSSQQAREDAVQSLPLNELTGETRRKLMAVCERPTMFRRLPQQTITCDPTLHVFLVRNPEVVVNIWQLMKVANMTADRQGPFLWKGSDGAGTVCDVELVYGTDDLHIIYSDGFYEGSLLRNKVNGRCVMCLRSGYAQGPDRRPYVANRLDLFLQIDNLAADAVTRTLSPWVGKVADANFRESCVFASKLSQTAEQNSDGVQRLADRLTNVQPPVREEFSRITATVPERVAAISNGGSVQRR